MLPEYLARVPLYRDYPVPSILDRTPGTVFLDPLPFITKRDIGRNFPRNFLPDTADLENLVESGAVELEQTSGTSESRTPLLLPGGWWARQEERALRLNPVAKALLDQEPHPRRVTINSPMCSNEISYKTVPTRAQRTLGNALFLSLSRYPFLWGENDLARMAEEALEWNPRFLDVDPVYGVVFALYCERQGIRLPGLKFMLGSYSFVSRTHRRVMERAFGVPILNLYGSTETGHLLMEGAEGFMRQSPETACLERIHRDEQGVEELVVTTLDNEFMPLVRYRIGDLVEHTPGENYRVHGRRLDTFEVEGRRLTTLQVDQAFEGVDGIAHYQFLQRPAGQWLLRWVADRQAPEPGALEQLQNRLKQLTSSSLVELHQMDSLMPETSGKFRLTCPLRRAGAPLPV